MACREALSSAAQRGMVLDAAGMGGSRIDFILFVKERVTFIRVKRSHSRIITLGQLSVQFSSEIADLRKVPLTPVVSRELWIFLPWGTWQYYKISDENVTEINDDGGKISGIHVDSASVKDPGMPVPPHEGT